ncbi:MAG TPA: hypothetical protein VE988_20500 [Gemmataceae bacterium]|nr:hypothetical protein [Gemmataceae bacterium]
MPSAIKSPTISPWPAEVVDFAALHGVAPLLDEIRATLERLFPSALKVDVRIESDPEMQDDCHLLFDVRVSRLDVPDFGAAKRRWHEELFRLCPPRHVCLFRLTLVRVA